MTFSTFSFGNQGFQFEYVVLRCTARSALRERREIESMTLNSSRPPVPGGLNMGSPIGLLDYTTITIVLHGFGNYPFYRDN